jgi:hypothetical protein
VATNFAGASFKVMIELAGDVDPKTNPAFALTTTEFFDPGFKFVNVYLVVMTETKRESFKRMSYALAPGTGVQFNSEVV